MVIFIVMLSGVTQKATSYILILSPNEDPGGIGPNKYEMASCALCTSRNGSLRKCSRCKTVYYCNRECQKLHWKTHKLTCFPCQGISGTKVREHFPQPLKKDLKSRAEFISRSLKEIHLCVIDELFEHDIALKILAEVKELHSSGIFQDGLLSGGKTASEDEEKFTEKKIRGDKITWLEGNENHVPSIVKLIELVDSLVISCGELPDGLNGYFIEGRSKAMVACYPGSGTGYKRHVDNPDGDGRCLTVIYYLNQGWCEDVGGKLKIYRPDDSNSINVEPVLNRLLLFWSDGRNPHEVLPAYFTRYAITIWYFDADQRRRAKQLHKFETMRDLDVEFALRDVEAKRKERDMTEMKLKEESERLVKDLLSEEDINALSALIRHHPDPYEVLNGLGIQSSVQEALLKMLVERE